MITLPTYVNPGEVKSGIQNQVFNSGAIGSCIVVVALDNTIKVGAMAHILLPGTAPEKSTHNELKFTTNALDEIDMQLRKLESSLLQTDVFIAGGANVLKHHDDIICEANITSIRTELSKRKIKAKYTSLGGNLRRVVEVHLAAGKLYISEGDGDLLLRWQNMK